MCYILFTMAYNFTKTMVQEAIESGGTIARVAKSLGCTWPTAKQYIEKFGLLSTLPEAAAGLGELAEESMLNVLTRAATDTDYARTVQPSIIFTLKCKRQWIEKSALLIGQDDDSRCPHERLLDALDAISDESPGAESGTEGDDNAGTVQTG